MELDGAMISSVPSLRRGDRSSGSLGRGGDSAVDRKDTMGEVVKGKKGSRQWYCERRCCER